MPRPGAPARTASSKPSKAAIEPETPRGEARSTETSHLADVQREAETRSRVLRAGNRAATRSESKVAEVEPAVTAPQDASRVSGVNPRTSAPVTPRGEPSGGLARTASSDTTARITEPGQKGRAAPETAPAIQRGERQSDDQKAATRTISLPEAIVRAPARRATPAPAERAAPRVPSAPIRATPAPMGHSEKPPSVTVTIGRVEIRGTRPATPKQRPQRRAPSARAHSIAPNYPGAF